MPRSNVVQLHATDPSEIDQYAEAIADETRGKLILLCSGSKEPLNRWTEESVGLADAKRHMRTGNVGYRVGKTEMVIDVDPRNGGDRSIERLAADTGFDIDSCFCVKTPGGGFHYYLRSPEGTKSATLEGYPGVDIICHGKYVVAPGSLHPNGGTYGSVWRETDLTDTPSAPEKLLALLRKPERKGGAEEAGKHTPEELASMLTGLDPTQYQEHDKWLDLMMSCHHATAGAGMDEFADWSASDPEFEADREQTVTRWNSLSADRTDAVTYKFLYKELHRAKKDELIPTSDVEDDFAGEAEPKKLSAELKKLCDEWVWTADTCTFLRRKRSKKNKYRPVRRDREQWENTHAHLWKGKKLITRAVFEGNLPLRKYETTAYMPGEDEFPEGRDGEVYNIWQPSGVEAKQGNATPFTEFVAYMFPNREERDLLLDWLALSIRGQKLRYALLIKGPQGVGKSTLARLMAKIVGEANTVEPSNDYVLGQFNDWVEGVQLIVVHELMTRGRLDLMNRLKSVISEDTVHINGKHIRAYPSDNHANLLALTNHSDPVKLDDDDRRWLVLATKVKRRGDDYFDELNAFIDSEDGPAAVKHLLLSRPTKLRSQGRAPETQAKRDMLEYSKDDADQYLMEMFNEGQWPFISDLVKLKDVKGALSSSIDGVRCKKPFPAALKFLKERIGAVEAPRNTNRGADSARLWITKNREHWLEASPAERTAEYDEKMKEWMNDKSK